MWRYFLKSRRKKKRKHKIGSGRLLRNNEVPRIEKHYISSDYKSRKSMLPDIF